MEPKITFTKNQEVRRKRRMRVLVVLILLALVLVAVVIGFLRKPTFQISSVTITGTSSLDSNEIQLAAQKHISGNYVLVIPRTNVLLFSKTMMNEYLMNQFPGIASVDTEFSSPTMLSISITEKKPAYLWCTAQCYFVDDSGMVYQDSPTFTPGVFLEFFGTTPTATITDPSDPIRRRFASVAEFTKSISVVNDLSTYPMHIISLKYLSLADSTPQLATGVGDVALTIDQIGNSVIPNTAQILILQSQDAATIAQALGLVLADKSFQDTFSAHPETLQYIDLRFPGKIYYKFQTATSVTPPVVAKPVVPIVKTAVSNKKTH